MVLGRLKDDGQGEIESVKARVEEGSTAQVSLEEDIKSKDADIQTLQARFADTQYLCMSPAFQQKEAANQLQWQ